MGSVRGPRAARAEAASSPTRAADYNSGLSSLATF